MSYNENNAYAQTQAPDIREASLRNKADEAAKYLFQAHELIDSLEEALRGPQPRPASGGSLDQPKMGHPGLRMSLSDISASAAGVCSRLSTIIADL